MACTAVSMEPCPVMMAISVCGNTCLTPGKNSRPDMLGIIRSARMMSGDSVSNRARAASALSASTQSNPTDAPTVMHSLRTLGWSSTIRNRTLASSVINQQSAKTKNQTQSQNQIKLKDQIERSNRKIKEQNQSSDHQRSKSKGRNSARPSENPFHDPDQVMHA